MRYAVAFLCVACCAAWSAADEPFSVPKGLAPLRIPDDNPMTAEKVALGKQLYFDKRLSTDNTISCASCHDPDKGWSNAEQFATGVGGKKGGRNSPTVLNSAYFALQFWDGRATHLEGQALGPDSEPDRNGHEARPGGRAAEQDRGIQPQFQKVFSTEVTGEGIAKAIASFERTVLSGDAPYDRFKAGDKTALSESAQAGMKVFFNKANCSACHSGANFSDGAFHNIGVGMTAKEPDLGRFVHTKLTGDRGAFQARPRLREIARTAPYMHDGSMKTLEEIVEWYDKGGHSNEQLDEEIFPLKLSAKDKADLVTFLKEGLASESYPDIEPPELPK